MDMTRVWLSLSCVISILACAKPPAESEPPPTDAPLIEESQPAQDEETELDEPDEPEELDAPDEQAQVVDAKELRLSPLRGSSYIVAPGTTITWSYESHGSVGKGGSCSSSSQMVVRYLREDVDYDNPEKMEAGMSGADGGTATVVFEALAAGSAEITCEVEFRGSVERTDTFSITVRTAN